jgi:hypothetical protein
MTRVERFRHEFVDSFPSPLADGTLYVSIMFASAAHNCACGCGRQVITPLSPTDWRMTYDGESVSLDPSIGNWSFQCRSHYYITRDRVKWSGEFSPEQVALVRELDRRAKSSYYETPPAPAAPVMPSVPRQQQSVLARISAFLRSWF